jgi:hypothetical protein
MLYQSIAVLSGLLLVSTSLAQNHHMVTETYYPAASTNGDLPGQASSMMGLRPNIAPLFIEESKISSSLILVNGSALRAGAIVSVRNLAGIEIARQHVSLERQSQKELKLASLLSQVTEPATRGSVSVLQDAEIQGMVILGQLVMTDRRNIIPGYIDEELAMPGVADSPVLRGVADEAIGMPLLAVSNLADMPQHVNIRCLGESARVAPVTTVIAAPGAFLGRACPAEPLESVDGYFQSQSSGKSAGVQGIEIAGDKRRHARCVALAPHQRRSSVILSSVPFKDPKLLHSPTTAFTGVPFGSQAVLADGLYIPHIALTNFSSKPAHATITVATSNSRLAGDSGEAQVAANRQDARQITIPPRSSAEVVLDEAAGQSGLLHSVVVASDREDGELLSKLVSRSDENLYELEMLGKDEKDQENAGGHPWTTEDGAEPHLLLFNHSASPRAFFVTIGSGGTLWEKHYTLGPYETRDISFIEIARDKLPDDKKRALSAASRAGIVSWMTPDAEQGTGRLLVSSRSAAMARSFSCGSYFVVCGLGMLVYQSGIIPHGGFVEYSDAIPQWCLSWGPGNCSGQSTTRGGASYYWSDSRAPGQHKWANHASVGSTGCCRSSKPDYVDGDANSSRGHLSVDRIGNTCHSFQCNVSNSHYNFANEFGNCVDRGAVYV